MISHKKITIRFLLLVLLCMECDFQLVVSAGEIRCMEREREALLRFKHGLIDEHGVLSSWGSDDDKKECCKWNRVLCSNTTNHVTALLLYGDSTSLGYDFHFYMFRGKISSALLELHHLNYLALSNNDFGGIRIPEFIGSIKSLEYLNLKESNFFGIIPPQLGNLTNLRTLDLSRNYNFLSENYNIWSENLSWLSHLSLLSYLDLSWSNIRDANWLQLVLKLPSLQEFYLEGCELTDVVFSVGLSVKSSSTSLSVLDLSYNQLTSSIFDWLFNMSTNLVHIDLSSNWLDGPVPDAFGQFFFLKYLYLYDNMFKGEIPKSLGNLSHLQALDLSENELGGSLEEFLENLSCKEIVGLRFSKNQFIGSVPDLRKFSELTELFLDNNNLTGTLPVSLGHLSKLIWLDVSFNSLEGTISAAHFLKLHNIELLRLSFNSLSFDLGPDWVPPFHLDEVDLASCKVGPSFPTWLQTQRNLGWLDLSCNGISDEVPKWLWWDLSVSYLNLSYNQIYGTIPDLSSSINYILDVSSNKFSGPIPLLHPNIKVVQLNQNMFSGSSSSICAIPHGMLRLLDLSNNQLAGPLPNCWENMTELMVLNLNNNSFSGEIPHALGSLQNLVTLHLGSNYLFGKLPSTLKNCQFLQLLDVGGNELIGNIPSWLGANYASMTYLILRQNRFYGDIPPAICNLTQIQVLDLSGNNISGKIPRCFNNFASLVEENRTTTSAIGISVSPNYYVDSALVEWKRQHSEYKNTLGLLKLIDLSSNKLAGSIPKEFSSLKGLISLNLSRNSLTGSIDQNIGQMEMLECLDLSRNQLSGEIPVGLAQLYYLNTLDLANNNLSGKIPLGTQLQSFNESVYTGNNGLCGRPLNLCREDGLNSSTSSKGENIKKKDGGFMSLSFMQEFGISMALGFVVGFWGVVGSLLLKESWRSAYFNFLDAIGSWLNMTTTTFLAKFRPS